MPVLDDSCCLRWHPAARVPRWPLRCSRDTRRSSFPSRQQRLHLLPSDAPRRITSGRSLDRSLLAHVDPEHIQTSGRPSGTTRTDHARPPPVAQRCAVRRSERKDPNHMQKPKTPSVAPNRGRADGGDTRGRQPLCPGRTTGAQIVGPTGRGKTTLTVSMVPAAISGKEG